MLDRQPVRAAARPAPGDELLDPFAEERAEAARNLPGLRDRLVAPLERGGPSGPSEFQRQLRSLGAFERDALRGDAELFRRLWQVGIRGLARWMVELRLEFGAKLPYRVRHLLSAVSGRRAAEIHGLLMAYPSLKRVSGLRAALQHQFGGRELSYLLARLDEPAGAREEREITVRSAQYEEGELELGTRRRRFELVRGPRQLRVIVRIRVRPDPDDPGKITDRLIDRWRTAIERRWNRRFRIRSGPTRLEVWFVPVFVFGTAPGAHYKVRVSPGNEQANVKHWYEGDSPDTIAHEFGHMIGNPDEYDLPATMAEIPRRWGLTEEERRRSSYEGLTGEKKPISEEGHDVTGIMGSHAKDASVHLRHGWNVLRAFNASRLRRLGEEPFMLERW